MRLRADPYRSQITKLSAVMEVSVQIDLPILTKIGKLTEHPRMLHLSCQMKHDTSRRRQSLLFRSLHPGALNVCWESTELDANGHFRYNKLGSSDIKLERTGPATSWPHYLAALAGVALPRGRGRAGRQGRGRGRGGRRGRGIQARRRSCCSATVEAVTPRGTPFA